jgi:hypothetical protein
MTVFGGIDNTNTTLNEVWVLSNANGLGGTSVWTQLAPSGTLPAARFGHSAVIDPASNRMIVFAGNGFNDIWVLSEANGVGGTPSWTPLSPSGGPPSARQFPTAVYTAASNRMTVFAGSPDGGTGLNDVWVLSDANGLPTYACSGFQPPFNAPLSLNRNVNRAIPVKMQMFLGGTVITDLNITGAAPVVNISFSSGGGPATDVTSELLPLGQSDTGNQFRFDVSSNQWIYNLGTKPFTAAGTYTVTAVPGDTSYLISPTCIGQFVRQ